MQSLIDPQLNGYNRFLMNMFAIQDYWLYIKELKSRKGYKQGVFDQRI